jgi:phenylpyruvate tautomerase PptA (4-oxalocrotonate tautomerase family)
MGCSESCIWRRWGGGHTFLLLSGDRQRSEHIRVTSNVNEALDIERSERFVLVRVTLAAGRATAVKQAFYRRLSELLSARAGLSSNDLAVTLVENDREDWSFGRGQANYLELPREAWR